MLSLAYSHEENSLVESKNRDILGHIRSMVFDMKSIDFWSECIPVAQRVCNAEIAESLGFSPGHLLFGSEIDLDRGILSENTVEKYYEHGSAFITSI